MRGRDKFAKYKSAIHLLVQFYSIFPRGLRLRLFTNMRNKAGMVALVKRYALLKTLAKSVGDNVSIFPGVYLLNVQELEIGDNVSIQPMAYIESYGGIKIGNNVSFAEGASLFSVSHGYKDVNVPIKDQGLIPLPIEIQDNVWIGTKATILGGVTVSSGCIVAAGAVVNKSTEENTVVGGVPAKLLRKRV